MCKKKIKKKYLFKDISYKFKLIIEMVLYCPYVTKPDALTELHMLQIFLKWAYQSCGTRRLLPSLAV